MKKYYVKWALGISLLSCLASHSVGAQAKTPSMILGEPKPEEMVYTSLSEAQLKGMEVYKLRLDYQSNAPLAEVAWEGFRNLRSLSLRHCRLSSLPLSMGQLPRLEVLNLGSNPELDEVALLEVLQHLPQLRHLIVDSCALRYLPETISRLLPLRELNIHGNRLYELPASLWEMPHLQNLDASGNLIQNLRLPGEIQAPLRRVELSVNLLDGIPGALLACPSLEKLYLDYTNIRELGDSVPARDRPLQVFLRGNDLRGTFPPSASVIWQVE